MNSSKPPDFLVSVYHSHLNRVIVWGMHIKNYFLNVNYAK